MVSRGGIYTVEIDGEHIEITALEPDTLRRVWAERTRDRNDLLTLCDRANRGWRGIVCRLIGVRLPDRRRIRISAVKQGRPL